MQALQSRKHEKWPHSGPNKNLLVGFSHRKIDLMPVLTEGGRPKLCPPHRRSVVRLCIAVNPSRPSPFCSAAIPPRPSLLRRRSFDFRHPHAHTRVHSYSPRRLCCPSPGVSSWVPSRVPLLSSACSQWCRRWLLLSSTTSVSPVGRRARLSMGGLFAKLRSVFFTRKLELVLVGLANAGKTTFCQWNSGDAPVPEEQRAGRRGTRGADAGMCPGLAPVVVGLASSVLAVPSPSLSGNFLHTGRFVEEGPTIGLNVKVMQKGGVTTKIWDLGGQAKYRSEWSVDARGTDSKEPTEREAGDAKPFGADSGWCFSGGVTCLSRRSRYTRGCDVIVFVIDLTAPNDLPTARKELHQLLEDRDLAKLPLLILGNKIDLGPKITEPELIKGLNLDYITDNPWLIVPVSAKNGTNVEQALEFLLKQSRA